MTGVNIRFNPDRCRWEAVVDGDEVGFLDYQVNCGIVEMSRTEVDLGAGDDRAPESVTQALIRAGLEQARDDGLRVQATSPVVDDYLHEHREAYGDLR